MASDDEIRKAILRKMLRGEFIGAKHTSIENVPKGFPKSERGNVKKVAEKLVKEGYFICKPKPDALHVSLNPKMLPQIVREIESEE